MSLFILGPLLLGLRQPIPESGFFYEIRDGHRVYRVQGIFRSSYVDNDWLNSVEGGFPRFVVWIAITPSNALDKEPTGICFFDDDGDYSGFLPLSEDLSGIVESIKVDGKVIDLTLLRNGTREKLSFTDGDADIPWP
nr:hypothetical protein [uncultured Dethiosulfovibrio sp.]